MIDPDTTPVEIWKPVPNYEGYYEVSSCGRVRSTHPRRKHRGAHILKFNYWTHSKAIYPMVALHGPAGNRRVSVHVLMALAFIGPRPSPEHEVNHINGIKTDNRIENLEWVTPKEQREHASRLGLLAFGERNGHVTHPEKTKRGEECGQATTTEAQARAILADCRAGLGVTAAARKHGVSISVAWAIKSGRSWKHIR